MPIQNELHALAATRDYDAAILAFELLLLENLAAVKEKPSSVLYAARLLSPQGQVKVAHQYRLDRSPQVRTQAQQLLKSEGLLEDDAWTGWLRRRSPGRLYRHAAGRAVQESHGVPPLETVGELRALLGIQSSRQLGWLLLASTTNLSGDAEGPYHTFTIPKSDGSPREIAAPCPQLRWVQRGILRTILSRVPPHEAAHGFVPGRSTVTNAAPHLGRHLLVKFDLSDFFPTIHYWRVVGLFAQLGYSTGDLRISTDDDSRAVAPVLARLCTFLPEPQAYGQGHTPQGAPTSPAICNLICRGLDARLAALTQTLGGDYTRYADDMTFSFPAEVPVGRLRWWVEELTRQEGFTVNSRKFRVIRQSQQQRVTGIVVNDKLTVPRRERRRFRAILHNCRKHGVASQSGGRADFADYLRGFASYVHMVQPEEGRQLLDEVEALLQADGASGGTP